MVLWLVLRVRVADWPAVMLPGLKLAVAPVGNPDAASAIDCGLPLVTALLITLEPPWPATTLTEDGEADSEKSFGGGATVRVTVVVWVNELPVPVTVIG